MSSTKKASYKRKISSEEAGGNYLLIQKRDLDFFPKVGKPFTLKVGKKSFETYVEATECWCQGPQKPHSHYRLNLSELRDDINLQWGKKVVIEKADEKNYTVVAV